MRTPPLANKALRIHRSAPLATILWALSTACGGEGAAGPALSAVIDRETFVATYVDLRASGLRGDGILSPEERSQTLARHGVTEEDLIRFAEAHGPDLPYMRETWDQVEVRLEAEPLLVDSAAGP
jgi:hypothetical protein